MFTITLNDGTKLKNLELNGNNYIADKVIEDSVFEDNLATVTVTDGKTTDTYTDMVLISNRNVDGHSWFVLAEKTEQEKTMERFTNLLQTNRDDITDVEIALAEVYEMIMGGN